ncbi:MAG: hypothetical protein HGA84_00670 [Syntrophobacteraceae bacterium]|nr:hypothetical protein [Syntrophobacteraceae bacterium]
MEKARDVLPMVVSIVAFCLFFPLPGFAVTDLVRETPSGQKWQQMDGEIQTLRDRLAADPEPRTSAEANKRIQIMNRIITLYGEGRLMFAEAMPVTGDPDRERQWYAHMARSCRLYGDAWRRKATEVESTAASLRGQGK